MSSVVKLKLKPICDLCGSDRLYREAGVMYDPSSGDWTNIQTVYNDKLQCGECGMIYNEDLRWIPSGGVQ